MNILIVISEFADGGAERVIVSIARGFVKGNNTITLLSFNSFRSNVLLGTMPREARAVTLAKEKISGVKFVFKLRRLLRSGKEFDVILGNLQPAAYYLSLLLPVIRRPVVYILHNDYPLLKNPLKRTVLDRFYRSQKVSLVSVSEQITESFAAKHGIRPVTIPNGITAPAVTELRDTVRDFVESLKQNEETIIFTGVQRLVWFKNLPALAEAFRIIHQRGYNAILLLLGEDPLPGSPEAEKIRLAGAPNVFLLGAKENIGDFLSLADCFCIVSSAFEGSPVALLEAISMGLPVIGTRTGGIPYIVSEPVNGILCQPTAESIADALVRFIEMPKELKIGIRAANRKLYHEKFDEEIMTERYNQFVNSLIGPGQ